MECRCLVVALVALLAAPSARALESLEDEQAHEAAREKA